MESNLSTHHAQLSFMPGLDEARLAVFDNGDEPAAETSWRVSSNYQPGPAHWDYQLHRLGYHRRSRWQAEGLGFRCDVEPITRGAS